MKLKDIAATLIGKEVCIRAPNEDRSFSLSPGRKAVVVATGWSSGGYNRLHYSSGNGVAIARPGYNNEWNPEIVPPSHVVGSWEDACATHDKIRFTQDEKKAKADDRNQKLENARTKICAELEALGLVQTTHYTKPHDNCEVTLTLAGLRRLLDKIQ